MTWILKEDLWHIPHFVTTIKTWMDTDFGDKYVPMVFSCWVFVGEVCFVDLILIEVTIVFAHLASFPFY